MLLIALTQIWTQPIKYINHVERFTLAERSLEPNWCSYSGFPADQHSPATVTTSKHLLGGGVSVAGWEEEARRRRGVARSARARVIFYFCATPEGPNSQHALGRSSSTYYTCRAPSRDAALAGPHRVLSPSSFSSRWGGIVCVSACVCEWVWSGLSKSELICVRMFPPGVLLYAPGRPLFFFPGK